MPSRFEDEAFDTIRRRLNVADQKWQLTPESLDVLPMAIRRVKFENGVLPGYGVRFNPLLRCIVRRTRG